MPSASGVLIRGGGDLATGVALRLHRAGMQVVIAELPQPLAVRRAVSFAEAVYEGEHSVEGVRGMLIEAKQLPAWEEAGAVPVIVDSEASILSVMKFAVVVDARLMKIPPKPLPDEVPLHIGLGPGFCAGRDCHAVIETRRSHTLGRVYWTGTTQPDSGEPEGDRRRVLRAATNGVIEGLAKIGERVQEGQVIAKINEQVSVISPFEGVLRGLIRSGLHVTKGLKIGDVDARSAALAHAALQEVAFSPFDLQLRGVAVFGERKPRLLYVGVEPAEELLALYARTNAALARAGLPPSVGRRYVPHVTLAWLNNPPRDRIGAFIAAHNILALPAIRVENFVLMSSHRAANGASYQIEACYPD